MSPAQTPPDPFDAAGRDFLRLAPLLWDRTSAPLSATAAPQEGERVLDACAGVGSSAVPAAIAVGPRGHVDAVDTSAVLIGLLRQRPDRPDWLHPHHHDVTAWPPVPGGYDLVQCALGLFFFPSMAEGVEHLLALTAPRGRLVASIWRRGAMVAVGEALLAAHDRVVARSTPPAVSPLADINSRSTFSRWFTDRGGRDVQVEEHQLHVPLEPEQAWLVVVGSGWRGMLEQHPAAQREAIRQEFMDEIARRGIDGVDATTLVAQGRRT